MIFRQIILRRLRSMFVYVASVDHILDNVLCKIRNGPDHCILPVVLRDKILAEQSNVIECDVLF